MEKIVIGRDAFEDIMYYVNRTNFEISGFGAVEVIDGVPTVTSIYIMDQENSMAETEIDGSSLAKVEAEHIMSGKPGELRFWWHSHVNMDVFWSTTDMKAIEMLTENGWFIHGVFNKKDEVRCAYSNNEPVSVFVDDIELEIDESLVNEDVREINKEIDLLYSKVESVYKARNKILDESFKKHVKIKTYNYGNYGNRKNGFPKTGNTSGIYDASEKFYNFNEYLDSGNKGAIPFSEKKKPGTPETEIKSSDYEYHEDWLGYLELSRAGYSDEEIVTFNYMGIYDMDDLQDYENIKGKA